MQIVPGWHMCIHKTLEIVLWKLVHCCFCTLYLSWLLYLRLLGIIMPNYLLLGHPLYFRRPYKKSIKEQLNDAYDIID